MDDRSEEDLVAHGDEAAKSAAGHELSNSWSLAFASLSTDDFAFEGRRASRILAQELETVFSDLPSGTRMVLVDPKRQLFQNLLPARLAIVSDPDATLLTPRCRVVAVGSNKLFKAAGDSLNVSLHKTLGDRLESATRALFPNQSGVIGRTYLVPIQQDLRPTDHHELEFVLQTLGPNMNPKRLDYLDDDYEKGEEQLRLAYRALFRAFLQLVVPSEDALPRQAGFSTAGDSQTKSTAKDVLDLSAEVTIPPYDPPLSTPPPLPGLSLRPFMELNPQAPYSRLVWFDHGRDMVVIYDGYPKASFHALVVHRRIGLDAIGDARAPHLSMLKDMHALARTLVTTRGLVGPCGARIGYHAKPSLVPLHLHVISADLSGPRLNSKKHWNSFMHPELFVPCDRVERDIAEHGQVRVLRRDELHDLEGASMRCWACGMTPHSARSQKDTLSLLKAHTCARALPTWAVPS